MKKGLIQICVLLLCVSTTRAAVKNVFFAGGQSNATAAWGAAIESNLQAEYGSDLVMVHVYHPGNAMSAWWTTGPQANYTNDFFNSSGTGVLQAGIAAITNAGDEVDFKGFFWFQGESDTGSTNTMDAYTAKFNGMMAQLKSDLGMTNDIDFTMALIDMNSDSYYDDPANTGGRSRGDLEYFRDMQRALCAGSHGTYADTREYTRTDTWHLTTAERARFAEAQAAAHIAAFTIPVTIDIFSDDADGCVYQTATGGGYFDAIDQICGIVDSNKYNGVSFFQLPSNFVNTASLSLTVVTDSGAMADANIDLWGLGYMSATSMNRDWVLLADTDTRLLLNNTAPVKIADNIVTNGQPMPVNTVWETDTGEQATLKAYINGLYDNGAVAGDFVVFRTNPDASPAGRTAGLRWGGSNQSTNKMAKLTVSLSDVSTVDDSITVTSHTKDGCIYDTGKFESNNLICGYTGGHPYNGIMFFELPTNRIETANINMTVAQNYGPLTNANIDVWGLGYMSDPVMDHNWQLMADTDTRSLINDNVTFTKIADNFIASGETTPAGSVDQLNDDDSTNLVAFLNSLFDKGAMPGDYAVIRVNPDAWFTANQNVRWADEVNSGTRATMTMTLTEEPAIPPPVDDITIYSHANDGTIYGEGPGYFTEQKLICGTAGVPNTRPWNGISFFQLPSNRVTSANLIFKVQSTAGSWSATGSGIDVWGLGTIRGTPTMDPSWLVMDDVDTRELLNGTAPTKLADNLVTAGTQPAVDEVYMLSTDQRSGLVDYINALFDMGAQPGDYVVIRLNPDVDIDAGGVNIYFGSSAETSPDRRAAFTVTLSDEPAVIPDSGTMYSHENDGTIYGETAGYFDHIQLICGTAGNPNTRPWNGISFFQLPHKRFTEADLAYTIYQTSSGWAATGSAIDVWGLGFISGTPVMDPAAWLLMGDADTRILLNNSMPSKIADNLVAAGSSPAVDDVYQLNAAQKVNLVNFLNGLFDKGAQPGDYAVIRINPDVDIEAGGVSLYFGSSSDISPDRRNALTYTLSDLYPSNGLYKHYSHANDGGVYGFGANSGWDLDSSTGGNPTFDISGIAFFALPEQPMTSVSLSMVAESFWGVLVDANLDMWGLGYMSAPTLDQDWLCISNTETRTFLNEGAPVKLMEDFVASGETFPAGSTYTSTETQSSAITDYLNGLYRKGAKPGDFAVIRINMDASQAGLAAGVRWGGSHRTSPDHRAYISGQIMDSTNYLANGSLESGVGSTADNWTLVENGHHGERIYGSSRSGTRAFKMSADGTTGTYESMYIAQDIYSPDFAGKQVTLSGYASHSSEDPLVSGSNQKVYFRLFWLGGSQAGSMVDNNDAQNLVPTDVQDEYKPIYVSATAPEDVTGIKAVIIFDTGTTADSSITTGSGIVDDLRLTIFQPLPGDGTLIIIN